MKLSGLTASLLVVLGCACAPAAARAGVVINEIFYNAPDGVDDLQWVELHNTGKEPVELADWSIDEGKTFVFPADATIEGEGYLVVALNEDRFRAHYTGAAIGPMKRPLKRGGERLTLYDAKKERVDVARYGDRAPWPLSADGYSASLERICPTFSGDVAENWAASPLPAAAPKPSGTPGKQNACYAASLPPVLTGLRVSPEDLRPGQPLEVRAMTAGPVRAVSVLYRVVSGGAETKELELLMSTEEGKNTYSTAIPGQKANSIVRVRVKVTDEKDVSRIYPHPNDLRPTFSAYVSERAAPSPLPVALMIRVQPGEPYGATADGPRPRRGFLGLFGGGGGNDRDQPRPPRGSSAFVYVDGKTGKTTLFDHVNIQPRQRGRGQKVFFHKDKLLNGMSAVSIIHEGLDRWLLAEWLAYDVYRRAGSPAALSEFARVSMDGQVLGHQLIIERPNKGFLRRNKRDDGGDLYKLLWYGGGIVGQHEKRTNVATGHDRLLELVAKLQKTRGEEQWAVIQENFNVDQVATYFAVNMVLSHWDGYFNNYFTYHDVRDTRKWEMYPWDQDKTWGYHDGIGNGVFTHMPLSFGMEGDRPPAGQGGFSGWWRPGGHFSGKLLANPQFRAIYLRKVKEILTEVYTETAYVPLLEGMAKRLKEDAALRGDGEGVGERIDQAVELLKRHLVERRAFLLKQEELRRVDGEAPRTSG